MSRLLTSAFLFFSLVANATSIPLLGDSLYPESVARDERDGSLYVGSNGDGSIQKVTDGVARVFQTAGRDGREETLGVKVDEARDRLWVVSPGAVYVYKIGSNTLLAKVPLALDNPGLNDLAIDSRGSAYVTESFHPVLLKIDGDTFQPTLRELKGIPYGTQGDFKYNLNGVVLSADEKSLIAVKTNEGTLWRIALDSPAVAPIALEEAVTKGDGLVWGKDGMLYVIRNFENKISRIDFSAGEETKARPVQTLSTTGLSIPTSAVFTGQSLIVVNSQFGKSPLELPFRLSVVTP